MTSFNFSTGNPANLFAGGGAAMSDIQGSLNDVRTFLNSGTIDETNVPNLSAAFTTYKTVLWGGAQIPVGTIGGTWLMYPGITTNPVIAVGSTNTASLAFYLDPADFAANARTTKLRVRAQCVVNATAPGTNFIAGLSQATSFGGTSGNPPTISGISAVIAGSQATFTTPASGSATAAVSSDFNAPTAGFYALTVQVGGLTPAGSISDLVVQLQMRQV